MKMMKSIEILMTWLLLMIFVDGYDTLKSYTISNRRNGLIAYSADPKSIQNQKRDFLFKITQKITTISAILTVSLKYPALGREGDDGAKSSSLNSMTNLVGYQTKSGLKFFDMIAGIPDTSPKYGQLVSFHYTAYFRPTGDGKLETVDSTYFINEPFLHKHGNGRLIKGIEEAIHTMNVGGRRRIIIPKSLGYNDIGLGPVPVDFLRYFFKIEIKYLLIYIIIVITIILFRRKKLSSILDKVERNEGELVFDLDLMMVYKKIVIYYSLHLSKYFKILVI
jgi:hypothetical protein